MLGEPDSNLKQSAFHTTLTHAKYDRFETGYPSIVEDGCDQKQQPYDVLFGSERLWKKTNWLVVEKNWEVTTDEIAQPFLNKNVLRKTGSFSFF